MTFSLHGFYFHALSLQPNRRAAAKKKKTIIISCVAAVLVIALIISLIAAIKKANNPASAISTQYKIVINKRLAYRGFYDISKGYKSLYYAVLFNCCVTNGLDGGGGRTAD